MKIDFENKTIIVTGAAHGLGRAIAVGFAQRLGTVWACDIRSDELEQTQRECQQVSGRCEIRTVDVTNRETVQAFVAEVVAASGQVDVLVNNAGGVLGQSGQPIENVSTEQWQRIFDVNVNAAFWCTQAVAPHMKEKYAGRIINIASGAGLGISLTGIQAYASAKAAQIGLTRQTAHELGPWGITVNSVAPGFVRSNPDSERQWQAYGPEGQAAIIEDIALKRLGIPDDITHSVLFLASEYAKYITGQVLSVDGGK